MELQIKIIGILLMSLALVHVVFPRYFNWKEQLKHLDLINRQMMTVHTFFIALTVFLMGLLCVTHSHDLITSELGRSMSLGLAIFWLIRLVFQLFVYSPKLWRGKTFETLVHVSFTCFWLYMTVVFGMIYFM